MKSDMMKWLLLVLLFPLCDFVFLLFVGRAGRRTGHMVFRGGKSARSWPQPTAILPAKRVRAGKTVGRPEKIHSARRNSCSGFRRFVVSVSVSLKLPN